MITKSKKNTLYTWLRRRLHQNWCKIQSRACPAVNAMHVYSLWKVGAPHTPRSRGVEKIAVSSTSGNAASKDFPQCIAHTLSNCTSPFHAVELNSLIFRFLLLSSPYKLAMTMTTTLSCSECHLTKRACSLHMPAAALQQSFVLGCNTSLPSPPSGKFEFFLNTLNST
jgi:hypothetical protein